MISFDVMSLFTRVPIIEFFKLLRWHFSEGILVLYTNVLTSAYFPFDVKFCEQSRGVAMGFSLHPVTPDVFMEDFEDMIFSQANHNLLCWFCYMNDTFDIWPHGPEKLLRFVDHLNGLHRNKFTLETEENDHFVYFTSMSVGHRMAPRVVMFTGNLLTQAFTRTMDHIIIIPTNKPFLQPCHTDRGARRLWQVKPS